jgi:predicted nucleotidyltransferase
MITLSGLANPSRLLFGKSRGAVLSLLYGHPDESFYLRQVARLVRFGLGPVQRELKLLTEAGLIRRSVSGRQVYFQADSSSPLFPELKSLITKTVGVSDVIRRALIPLEGRIKAAFIYGSIAAGGENRDSDIDLLVVGDVSFSEVVAHLQDSQNVLSREINPTVYSQAEFRVKIREKHFFLTSVINGPKIFLIGDERELEGLAGKRLARRAQGRAAGDRRPSRPRRPRPA